MWGMGGWTGSDDEESLRSLQHAVDLGCNFFDTAWAYGEGRSEALLGQLVRANSQQRLYTATKIPPKNETWPSRREFTLDDTFPPHYIERRRHERPGPPRPERFDPVPFYFWGESWVEDDRWVKKKHQVSAQGMVIAVCLSTNR